MTQQIKEVAFATNELKQACLKLERGKFEEKQLFEFINRAVDDLKNNPFCGIRIPKKLWPKEYIKKYKVTNLWKYNLPDYWRLIYTLIGNKIRIISMILEWMNHKDYEKKFKY